MAYPFQRTLRSLNADASSIHVTLAVLGMLAALGLTIWAVGGRVPLVKVSTQGRIEPHNAVHRIEPPEAGRVLRSTLELDREVSQDELLIELDTREEQLELARNEANSEALARDLVLLSAQISSKEAELAAGIRMDEASLREASAKNTELIPRRLLAEQRQRLVKDSPSGSISGLEKLERETEAEELVRASRTQAFGVARLQREQVVRRETIHAQLLSLARDRLKTEAQLGELSAAIARLSYQIDKKQVRAPASGLLVDVVELAAGAYVAQGQRLATVLAQGDSRVRVRARFPKETVGIIRRGQRARLKLDGYPWTVYGTLDARVSSVGTEPGIVATPEAIPGTVRVELAILPHADPRIMMQHGLTATVEIEVARVSPLALMMRAIGEWDYAAPEQVRVPLNSVAQGEAL